MFYNTILFEIKYQLKQRAFILFSLLFLLMGLQIGKIGYGQGTDIYNSSQSKIVKLASSALFWRFISDVTQSTSIPGFLICNSRAFAIILSSLLFESSLWQTGQK